MMVIFGIALFVLIFFPFYGISLRFHLGYILKKLFDTIGRFSLIGGAFLIILCLISVFLGRKIRVGWFIVAIVLLWVGSWSTGIIIDIWGFIIGTSENTGGGSGYF